MSEQVVEAEAGAIGPSDREMLGAAKALIEELWAKYLEASEEARLAFGMYEAARRAAEGASPPRLADLASDVSAASQRAASYARQLSHAQSTYNRYFAALRKPPSIFIRLGDPPEVVPGDPRP